MGGRPLTAIMDTQNSCTVLFKNGVGELTYPESFKRMGGATICCYNLHLPGIPNGGGECLFLISDASYYRDENFINQPNILAMFQLKKKGHLYYFKYPPMPLTITPQKIRFKIVTMNQEVKNVPAVGMFYLSGSCRDKQLLI